MIRSSSTRLHTPRNHTVISSARHHSPYVVLRHCVRKRPVVDAHCLPRAPLRDHGVTVFASRSWRESARVTPHSSLILAHAPDHHLPVGFVSLYLRVLAGCCEPLLHDGPSRRYLCDPCIGAWVPTPPRLSGAFVRFFPDHFGLILKLRDSARGRYPASSFPQGYCNEAATIRLSSGSHTCSTLRLL
jgi:hypothetical protein